MSLFGTLSLLVYTFGAFAFGSVSWYALRDPTWRTWARADSGCGGNAFDRIVGPTAMTLLSFIWFVVLIVRQLSAGSTRPGMLPIDLLFVSLALLFPGLIMHVAFSEARAGTPSAIPQAFVWAHRIVYATTWSNVAWLVLRALGIEVELGLPIGPFTALHIAASFAIAALYSILILSRSRRARRGEVGGRRQMDHWMYGLYGLMLVTVGAMVLFNFLGATLAELAQLVGTSMPLLFIFVGVYEESRFEFFDLFVKRGATMLLTLLALMLYFDRVAPAIAGLELPWEPWAHAILLLPAALLLPRIHRTIGRWLDDRWLGRRFDGVGAVKHFLFELGGATDEAGLCERARSGLTEIFRAPVQVALDGDPLQDCVHRVPIRTAPDAEPLGEIGLGRRANEVPWFSEDLALAASLSDVLGHALHNVRLQQNARELSLQASRSELKALRAQINPHFLFNALNAIAGLIHKDPDAADRTVEQLAEVFRYTLRGAQTEWSRLEDELEFVQAYLDVERARFGSRLAVTIDIEPSLLRAVIPTMVLQTLVENAVKHGVARVRGPARVALIARVEADGRARIEVHDSGPGPDGSAPGDGGGHGLHSIRERLRGHFGDRASLALERDEARATTVARVVLPIRRSVEESTSDGAASA